MSKPSTYVSFDGHCGHCGHCGRRGHCAEAFRFYERALGARITTSMTDAQFPSDAGPPFGPEVADRIMHVSLQVGNDVLKGPDAMMGEPPHPGNAGDSIHLALPDPARAAQVFNARADGGTANLPLEETFWAAPARFGSVTDRFDIDQMISVDAA